jgi:hypothetical protein
MFSAAENPLATKNTTYAFEVTGDVQKMVLQGNVIHYPLNEISHYPSGYSTPPTGRIVANTPPLETLVLQVPDLSAELTIATGVAQMRIPWGFHLTEVRANVESAPTGLSIVLDVNADGSSVFDVRLTIERDETSSATAAQQPTIIVPAIVSDALITVDLDKVGSTFGGAGLRVYLYGYRA